MALLRALGLFLTLPAGFRNGQLRLHVAALLGRALSDYRPGQMTYDLRRLRLKGLICRKPGSTRYELTPRFISPLSEQNLTLLFRCQISEAG